MNYSQIVVVKRWVPILDKSCFFILRISRNILPSTVMDIMKHF